MTHRFLNKYIARKAFWDDNSMNFTKSVISLPLVRRIDLGGLALWVEMEKAEHSDRRATYNFISVIVGPISWVGSRGRFRYF